ncbi:MULTISPECIES: adenylate/guanylate cyclase domain-containing protein [unclassified Bradyrhizobium]|uniref:adenylate/guanylate cyclase domain-containing protein n=1 Tax=unclassified Bradyrhizobium TaxID=2631580 RepID=UPI001BA46BEB|nr:MULTISPECIES: adenylate/guanylate cyclase domain-containing protein [unclassified Bradyrhizobium]MBR1226832.1 adenylate/guanylate cyclase domain-containing protein [Bradyrhizobium sp. AUGA SZCCT0176]MBR1299609.1 adenylate/guanylate cyclase domain-containing protein [Bradyrhizobium sp. AUGA SZCCT0042]
MVPKTQYAKSGDVRIAYQVVGEGPFDLVFVPGFISNLDVAWEEPYRARVWTRLAAFARLIMFDKRGTGLSDRTVGVPTLEERMDDVRAVMDAAGSQQAALFGISEGGAMSVLFAATYPERTRALVLYGTYGHFLSWVIPPDRIDAALERLEKNWGTGESLRLFAPSVASDETFKLSWARFERLGASPSAVVALMRMNSEIDVRPILPSIRVPTFIIHRQGDVRVNVEAGRFMARQIPNAKYLELPGSDHMLWTGATERILDEVEEFLTGSRSAIESDRVLATVLFTDIVNSTKRAEKIGDRAWHDVLDRHNALVRREISRHRGHEVRTMGDGFLATFDGPARSIRCALAINEGVEALGLQVRAGLHTGEVEMADDDLSGIAVHIASRVATMAKPGQVLVSNTVRDLVAGSNIRFHDEGSHSLKGLTETVRLFAAER